VRQLFLDDDPIPVGLRVADLIHVLAVHAADPASALARLRQAVEAGGASVDNIAQVSFFYQPRVDINPAWVELFPDPDDRPTYKFMVAGAPGVTIEAFAVAGQRRRPLHIPHVAHTNPIPMGVRIGDWLFSSRVLPYDPASGAPHDSIEAQTRHVFDNVRTLVDAGGMRPEHLRQGRLFLAEPSAEAERRWRNMAPSAALQVTTYQAGPLKVMLEVIARL
jgi:2-iminobutanoate/2-iminopropanoate deaminase